MSTQDRVLDDSIVRKVRLKESMPDIKKINKLHVAVRQGDLVAVKKIFADFGSEMAGNENHTTVVDEFRAAIVRAEGSSCETALYIAANNGYLDVVQELLKYADMECLTKMTRHGLNAFHVAARQGDHDVVQVLLKREAKFSNTTAAAGQVNILVDEVLPKDSSLVSSSTSDGETALHLAVQNGHVEIVKTLLVIAPHLAWRTDKEGQTALHMAVKGQNCEIVKLLIGVDAAILPLPDSKGNTALHTATRNKRYEMVKELLIHPRVNVNALNQDNKTALDLAEELPDSREIKDCLLSHGAVYRKDLIRKLQGHGTNTSSAYKAAILIAQIAFAAIFTVPGRNDRGSNRFFTSDMPIKILVVFNSVAFFSSLAVIVIQINTSKGEQEAEVLAAVADITAILIWLASASISVVFMTAIFVVVGRHFEEVTILITVTGGTILIGSICIRAYYEMKLRSIKLMRKKVK